MARREVETTHRVLGVSGLRRVELGKLVANVEIEVQDRDRMIPGSSSKLFAPRLASSIKNDRSVVSKLSAFW